MGTSAPINKTEEEVIGNYLNHLRIQKENIICSKKASESHSKVIRMLETSDNVKLIIII